VYGLFGNKEDAARAVESLQEKGITAHATVTLPRAKYWKELFKTGR
jgi:hypothetical protein